MHAEPPAANPNVALPYVSRASLTTLWLEEVAPRALRTETEEHGAILTDALALLCAQGELFMAGGLVFLDPAFATDLLKPLVDHRLKDPNHLRVQLQPQVDEYVRATGGGNSEHTAGPRTHVKRNTLRDTRQDTHRASGSRP